ncbi:DUF6000 family protein [Mucilaginibacter sp. SG564]|uniref:DUF6000 family protein n=1 Tax=Mucilaginibacter sp. SG564 TaxID=2587022 RepID=UPI001551733B|nr:DUF6000 family protein [Mucilaginibacter sp. SG564]NOW95153.1 hypothetical protein [Mucilaginibacter sp. SG564]
MSGKKLWTKLFSKKTEKEAIELHVAGAMVRHHNPFEDLTGPRNEEEFSDDIIDQYVLPFYMTSIANLDQSKLQEFAMTSHTINTKIVALLLGDFNWRTRLCGAFFAAINNYVEFEEIIGNHLLKSEVCYAGDAYCLALAQFDTDSAKNYLITYLNYYLDRKDLWFDQDDAYCALTYLDKNAADAFNDKWQSFISDKPNWSLEKHQNHFNAQMATIEKIRALANKDS